MKLTEPSVVVRPALIEGSSAGRRLDGTMRSRSGQIVPRLRPRLTALVAVAVCVVGLVVQFVTGNTVLEDLGLAGTFGGLVVLALVVPALLADPPPRQTDHTVRPSRPRQ